MRGRPGGASSSLTRDPTLVRSRRRWTASTRCTSRATTRWRRCLPPPPPASSSRSTACSTSWPLRSTSVPASTRTPLPRRRPRRRTAPSAARSGEGAAAGRGCETRALTASGHLSSPSDASAVALGHPVELVPPVAPRRRALERAVVVGAPVVYVVALGILIASWGLPVARDQLFFWVLLGLAAFSVSAWRTWGAMLLSWLPWLGLLVAYDELRGAVSVDPGHAHVTAQVAADRWLGAGAFPTEWLQRRLWSPLHLHWYDYAVWAIYMTHFFAVWLPPPRGRGRRPPPLRAE